MHFCKILKPTDQMKIKLNFKDHIKINLKRIFFPKIVMLLSMLRFFFKIKETIIKLFKLMTKLLFTFQLSFIHLVVNIYINVLRLINESFFIKDIKNVN